MGIFQQFPYTNFHEMNLDQIIKIMREMQDEWATTKAEWASYKDFIDNYFTNLNLDDETERALRRLIADGTLDNVIDPVIIQEVTAWLADHITQPTTPAIDTSLTVAGAAADAKAAGDAIRDIENTLYPDFSFQYLKKSATTDNSFWYKDSNNHIGYLSSNDMKRYNPVKVYAGIAYTLTHIYAEFTFMADNNGDYIASVKSLIAHVPDEHYNNDCSYVITPAQDCWLYVTRNKTKASGETMVLDGSYIPSYYIEGAYPKRMYGANPVSQLVNQSLNPTDNSFWYKDSNSNIGYLSGNDYKRFNPILLKAGVTYTFTNVYAQFTFISDLAGHYIRDFNITTTAVNVNYTGSYTPTQDCLLYMTRYKIHASGDNRVFTGDIEAITKTLSNNQGFTGYYTLADDVLKPSMDIHVAKDGSGDYDKIVDAVSAANAIQGTGTINIYIHTGTYDILSELGGATFLAGVENDSSERQGLGIWRDHVNLIGVGDVTLTCELPNTATYNQSARVSTLNLGQYDANIENLNIIAKNCRYAIHDECNGWSRHNRRIMKNIVCTHRGNQGGMWQYPHVLGGGAGGGCVYDFINCEFYTSSDDTAFSYHISNELEPCFFNVDGCIGVCNASTGKSFRFSYLGTGNNGTNRVHVKCCSGNANVIVEAENSSSTNNNIDLHVNGWESI